jgi:hypothetical protein
MRTLACMLRKLKMSIFFIIVYINDLISVCNNKDKLL